MYTRAAVEAWAAENLGPLAISLPREDGSVDAIHAFPYVSVYVPNLPLLGIGHLLQDDGTLRITDEVSYRPLRVLPNGSTAFELI